MLWVVHGKGSFSKQESPTETTTSRGGSMASGPNRTSTVPGYELPGRQRRRANGCPGVQVVSEPWSDYTKFGMYAARGNIDAAEDIRSLPRPRAADLGLPVQMPGYDYWLFDSRFIVVLHFDDETNDITRIEVPRNPYLILEPFASSLQVIVPFPSGRLRGSSHPVTLK